MSLVLVATVPNTRYLTYMPVLFTSITLPLEEAVHVGEILREISTLQSDNRGSQTCAYILLYIVQRSKCAINRALLKLIPYV